MTRNHERKSYFRRAVVIARILIGLSVCAFVWNSHSVHAQSNEVYEQMKLISEVYSHVEKDYIEPSEAEEIIRGACEGMVGKLDDFSQFMPPDTHKRMREDTEGEFGGLGIRIGMRDGILTVITPLPGTPAYRLGILPGDKIVKIEGESSEGITLNEALDKLRGKPGTKVTISIQREGEKELLDFTITREKIQIQTVYSEMLQEKIGYVHLTEFNEQTPGEFQRAWQELTKQGMEALVLDLRNNPGGLLTSAVEVCRSMIGDNRLIVYTQGRDPRQTVKFFADSKPKNSVIPMVVLVNKGSASGSEIVAGCIKDWKRGVLVGEKTFGKGSVQSVFSLSGGSGLRLTTARYYTPSGTCIDKIGIEPNIVVDVSRELAVKIMQQEEKIYKISPEEKAKQEEEKVEDPQLKRALDILTAHQIFAGTPEEAENATKQE